tara:strand:+ start:183 stop:845 length:663 start_codon:yes stop_codon:yes gene_type:complete
MSWFLVLKNIYPNSWANPTPKQEEKFLAKEWNILGKEIGQEILDYFKGDIPLNTWLDVNYLDRVLRRHNKSRKDIVRLPVNALKPVFYHWSLDYFNRGTDKKQNIISFLISMSNLMDETDNEKIGDEIFDLTRKYRGLGNREESRLKEENEKRLAILEEEKKESEWQKTLSIARQQGINPDNPRMGMMMIWNKKDTEALKEKIRQRVHPSRWEKIKERLQ